MFPVLICWAYDYDEWIKFCLNHTSWWCGNYVFPPWSNLVMWWLCGQLDTSWWCGDYVFPLIQAGDVVIMCSPRYKLVPPLVSTTNPYHRRRPHERVIPAHKTELYANSFIPSTTQLWNTLPQTIQTNPSISLLKIYCQRMTLWFLYIIIILVLARNKLSIVDFDLLLAI